MLLATCIGVPLLLLALSLGHGLLLMRLAGVNQRGLLLVPVGLATLIVVTTACSYFAATAPYTGAVVAVLAVTGLAADLRSQRWQGWAHLRRQIRPRGAWAWPALVGSLVLFAYLAPVVGYGHPAFTGYIRIVDIAHQLDLTSYLMQHGRDSAPDPASASAALTVSKLLSVGYPGGTQAALGSVAVVAGLDPIWVYQPFVAFLAACAGLGLYGVLGPAIAPRALRALAAGTASLASLTLAYGQEGGIKEVAALAMFLAAGGLLARHPPRHVGLRSLLLPAVPLAAGFASFSLAILPWIGTLVAVLILADLLRPGRVRAIASWAALVVLAGALSWPSITAATKLTAGGIAAVAQRPQELGNLAAPIDHAAAAGVWITADYRYPLVSAVAATRATHVAIILVLGLAALGVLAAARRRDRTLAVAVAAVVAVIFVLDRTDPWVNLKAYAITGPVALAFAFAGAASLTRRRVLRYPGALLVVALGLCVLWGAAAVYHGQTVTPYDRIRELESIDNRFAGHGPTLAPDFDETAEYMLRRIRASGLVDPAPGGWGIRPSVLASRPGLSFVRDTNDFIFQTFQHYPLIVKRRAPGRSRPPGNYSLAERTAHYEVWRRTSAGHDIVSHLPVAGQAPTAAASMCAGGVRAARRSHGRLRLTYATIVSSTTTKLSDTTHPPTWRVADPISGSLIPLGPGRVSGRLSLPGPGRYTVWLGEPVGRTLEVRIDGHRVGGVTLSDSYPPQFVSVGTVTLGPGGHRFEIIRGSAGLLPGSGNLTGLLVGPLILEQASSAARPAQTVAVRDLRTFCQQVRNLDWIELLRG